MKLTEETLLYAGYALALGLAGVVVTVAAMSFAPGVRRDAQDCAMRARHVFIVDTRECLAIPRNAFIPAQ